MSRATWREGERGQSLVEFAIMVPVLVVLLVGLADVGRAYLAYTTLGNAVREAARDAAVRGSGSAAPWGPAANDASVTAAVRARATGLDAPAVSVSSSWPQGNNARGSEVVISASYAFQPVAAAVLGNISFSLSATTRTRIYR